MSLCFMLFADHAEWQGIAEKSDLSYSQVTDNEKQWFGPQNRADTPLPGQTPSPGEHPPSWQTTPPRDGHWYPSYWNAFLLLINFYSFGRKFRINRW